MEVCVLALAGAALGLVLVLLFAAAAWRRRRRPARPEVPPERLFALEFRDAVQSRAELARGVPPAEAAAFAEHMFMQEVRGAGPREGFAAFLREGFGKKALEAVRRAQPLGTAFACRDEALARDDAGGDVLFLVLAGAKRRPRPDFGYRHLVVMSAERACELGDCAELVARADSVALCASLVKGRVALAPRAALYVRGAALVSPASLGLADARFLSASASRLVDLSGTAFASLRALHLKRCANVTVAGSLFPVLRALYIEDVPELIADGARLDALAALYVAGAGALDFLAGWRLPRLELCAISDARVSGKDLAAVLRPLPLRRLVLRNAETPFGPAEVRALLGDYAPEALIREAHLCLDLAELEIVGARGIVDLRVVAASVRAPKRLRVTLVSSNYILPAALRAAFAGFSASGESENLEAFAQGEQAAPRPRSGFWARR